MMDSLLTSLHSIQLRVAIKNKTIGIDVPKTPESRIVEFGDSALILEVPKVSCIIGNYIDVFVEITLPDQTKSKFESLAKVEQVERQGDVDRVRVSLIQFDPDSWTKFLGLFDTRQREIEDFLRAAKGL